MLSKVATAYDLSGKRVWVAGHRGLVGSALVRRLEREPIAELITANSSELDLRRQAETEAHLERSKPDVVLLAAARVGGINANRSRPAEFLYDNLMISANVVKAAHAFAVEKVVLLGSSCIYPRDATQPIDETALLTGALEETNEGYAVAKIAALELGKMYRRQFGVNIISLMPTNLYGPGDNFDLSTSHVLPALLRKVHEAKLNRMPELEVWGTGNPRREFLHVDDLADAVIVALQRYNEESHLNVGVGRDISIRELAELIADVIGWRGRFVFNTQMPDGTPQKLLNVSKMRALGWEPRISLTDGIKATYEWYLDRESGGLVQVDAPAKGSEARR